MVPPGPAFRPLTEDEIHDVLTRNHVGRIAYARVDRLDIVPIHYVYSEGWLYSRTTRGEKLEAALQCWPIAFQVDEIADLFDWRSVVVHGGLYTLSAEDGGWLRGEWGRAVAALRTLIPETFTAGDPTPSRDVVFRIAVQDATGQSATWERSQPLA
jgi:nitroimidazol reductase NimA-like FMN-containing flavoprotein (pyridoxamine 5'-phosphate oxidase superfamily)